MQEQTPRIDPDLPTTSDRQGRFIAVGTPVRSFDFADVGKTDVEGPDACFVEGIVEGVCRDFPDCPRYAIRPTRRVFAGKEKPAGDEAVFPPLNGTTSLITGRWTMGVTVVDLPACELPTEAQLREASDAGDLWVFAMGSYYLASFVRIKRTGAYEVSYTSGAGTTRKKTIKTTELAGSRPGLCLGDRPTHRRGDDARKAKAHRRAQLRRERTVGAR